MSADNTIEELEKGIYYSFLYLYNDESEEEVEPDVIIAFDKGYDDETGKIDDVTIYNMTFAENFTFAGVSYAEGATLEDCPRLHGFLEQEFKEDMRVEILDWANNLEYTTDL